MKSKIQISLLIIGIMVAFYCIYATFTDAPGMQHGGFISELNIEKIELLKLPGKQSIEMLSSPFSF